MRAELPLHSPLNLILTGYIEPNRPRISQRLAERLNLRFIDVERRVEAHFGESIAAIRARYGQQRLKAVESEVLDSLALHRQALIRVSGSTLLHSGQLEAFQRSGIVVCLTASLDAILRRIHIALGAGYHDPRERALALGELQREWQIREHSGIIEFDATHSTEAEVVDALAELWRARSVRGG